MFVICFVLLEISISLHDQQTCNVVLVRSHTRQIDSDQGEGVTVAVYHVMFISGTSSTETWEPYRNHLWNHGFYMVLYAFICFYIFLFFLYVFICFYRDIIPLAARFRWLNFDNLPRSRYEWKIGTPIHGWVDTEDRLFQTRGHRGVIHLINFDL